VRAKIDPLMAVGLDNAGFVTFGFTEGGFANPLSNEPIHSVDEMRRKKSMGPGKAIRSASSRWKPWACHPLPCR